MANRNTETLLVEIGTEELPPKSLKRLQLSLAASMQGQFKNADLGFDDLTCHATPRRLALIVTGLVDQQPDQSVERRGPAVKAAYDDDGNPSKALNGFMKSCGVEDPSELETLSTDKGEWLMYKATKPGAALSELLPSLLETALSELPIDRRMRWGANRAEFVRPVKWLLSVYGDEELPIKVLGFESGRVSRGHRFMSDGEFTINHANEYEASCRQHHVMVSFDERRRLIQESITAIANETGAELENDEDLLDEVASLVEWPVALKGTFDESFLAVPAEVLISAMKEHQRYFHLMKDGKLLPAFITIANLESTDPDVVIAGNERVIKPRLSDAAFFFDQDTKTSLEDKLGRLASVVFQTELGTYGEKADRISRLAGFIAGEINADVSAAERTGLLAKADLVSDMVGEFTDLQGVMGGHYARHDGESDEISKGIEQHYRPTQSGGELPEGPVASSVSLADKIDTLTGIFGIGQPPTGSRDPFALRRQSLGVIRICIENRLTLDLETCFTKSAELYDRSFETRPVIEYIIERLTAYYGELGIGKDVVDAAVSASGDGTELLAIDGVIRALQQFSSSESAGKIIAANKRVANLLKKSDADSLPAAFDTSLASEDAEHQLHKAIQEIGLDNADVETQMNSLASLQQPVDQFFEEVLVMDEDDKVRNNRLVLLRDLRNLFLRVADFSLLQE